MLPEELKKKFTNEVVRSLLLSDDDKQYWLVNMDDLPVTLVEYFHTIISDKNILVDSYINKALQDDPGIVPELKEKVKRLKKDILSLEESDEQGSRKLEETLEEELNTLS